MDTKLTLKLNETVIGKAKGFAKKQNTSLSRLIENYLLSITDAQEANDEITPLVKSLSGIIDLPKNADHKKAYTDFLIEKYK